MQFTSGLSRNYVTGDLSSTETYSPLWPRNQHQISIHTLELAIISSPTPSAEPGTLFNLHDFQ
jgi:hypothetical protein